MIGDVVHRSVDYEPFVALDIRVERDLTCRMYGFCLGKLSFRKRVVVHRVIGDSAAPRRRSSVESFLEAKARVARDN